MQNEGQISPPNVDTYTPNYDPGAAQGIQDQPDDHKNEGESPAGNDPVPLPPDVEKREPIEEPDPAKPPMGDDTDQIKRIVDSYG